MLIRVKKQQGWASVLFKRTQRSCVLCVLFCALEKNGKERNILLGFISRQKLKKERKRMLRSLHSFLFFRKERKRTEHTFGFHKSPKTQKRTEKNVVFFKRTEKNGTFRREKNALPNPLNS